MNEGSEDNVVVVEKLSEETCSYESEYLQSLRNIMMNKMTYDVKKSSSHGNCLFSAINQSEVAMNAGKKHHMFHGIKDISIYDIRLFVSKCYELNKDKGLHAKMMAPL